MDVRQTRLDWLRHLIAAEPGPERGSKARFAAKVGKAPAQISQWLGGSRTIDDETAREIEARLSLERWCIDRPITTAQAPQQVGDFGQVAAAGAGQAHPLKLYEFTVPPLIEWGELMKTKVLPPAFRLVANDDALAPKILRGTGLIMAAGHSAQPGQVILVQRGNGERHLRRYAVGADQAWRARAPNEDFPTYDSADDPDLTMLAVMRWIDAEGY